MTTLTTKCHINGSKTEEWTLNRDDATLKIKTTRTEIPCPDGGYTTETEIETHSASTLTALADEHYNGREYHYADIAMQIYQLFARAGVPNGDLDAPRDVLAAAERDRVETTASTDEQERLIGAATEHDVLEPTMN